MITRKRTLLLINTADVILSILMQASQNHFQQLGYEGNDNDDDDYVTGMDDLNRMRIVTIAAIKHHSIS